MGNERRCHLHDQLLQLAVLDRGEQCSLDRGDGGVAIFDFILEEALSNSSQERPFSFFMTAA